jgi:hypothetical protein
MRWWERAGRVVANQGASIPAFFARLALYLESGKITYDAASGGFDDGPTYFFDLSLAPRITSDTVIVYRAAELVRTVLGIDAAARLPPGAGPYGCVYYVMAPKHSRRLFAAIPEQDMDHIDEGMKLVEDVMPALIQRCDLSAYGATASTGFHGSPAEPVELWLRSHENLVLMPLATLLVALDPVPESDDAVHSALDELAPGETGELRDDDIGRLAFDQLVRGDAEIGLIPDVPDTSRT